MKKSNSAKNEFEIENLLKSGYIDHNALEFKVRWRGYDEARDSWKYSTEPPRKLVELFFHENDNSKPVWEIA